EHVMAKAAAPLWSLLRTFSWQELRHHGLRHAAAMLAVLLGVALAFSVHLINASALSEFSAAVRAVSGQADLQLRPAHGTLNEALYPKVARDAHVQIASPVIDLRVQASQADRRDSATPRASSPPMRGLRIVGIDPFVAGPLTPGLIPSLADAKEDRAEQAGQSEKDAQGLQTSKPARDRMTLFAPRVIFLNSQASRLLSANAGDKITVQAGLRTVHLEVVGSVAEAGEPLGVMDIASAQEAFGMVGQLSRLDVQLKPGASVDEALASLALPPQVLGETAQASAQRVSNVSRAYRVNLTVLALIALYTGAFLVFSVLSLSVAKRQQQFALLAVLGLSARERLQLVLLESALVGLVGSVLGIAARTGLAAMALKLLAGDLGGGYFPGIAPRLHWSGTAALVYGALGAGAAIWGGLVPALVAGRLPPAQTLKGMGQTESGQGLFWLGPLLMLIGAALTQLPLLQGVPLWAYIGVACLLTGGIACGPAAVALLLGGVRRYLPRAVLLRHPSWLLALARAHHLRRTATVTIAGVVASLSLAVALTVMV